MKKTLIVVGSIIGVLVVALLVAPFVIPVESFKPEILSQIEKATGRKARIDGDFGISLLPRIEFVAGKVSLANAPGGKAAQMVSLEKLEVGVEVFPLLSGTIAVDRFVLTRPVINLEVDRQGRPNWDLAPAAADGKRAEPGERSAGDKGGMAPSELRLGDVRLVGGRVSYNDARSGMSHAVEDINVSISLPSMTSPMEVDGSLVWNKEKIALKLGVRNPNAFLTGSATPLTASVSANPIKLSFKGEASSGQKVKASGAVDLDVPSVRKLAAWAGQPLTMPGEGFGPLRLAGQVGIDGQEYRFTQAKLTFDKIEGTGDVRFSAAGQRPYVSARLETGVVDVNPYLPPEKPAPGGTRKPQPGSDAKAPSQGWSDDPIDVSGLRAMDADAELRVAGLRVRKIKVDASRVTVALKNGRLTADLTDMALYEGNGKARLTADASGNTPTISATLNLSGLQANPALKDAADFDRIEGTLNTTLDVTTRGDSQRAMVSVLNGDGRIRFTDGAIRGINIAAMVRNVKEAFLDTTSREQQKTDFAELSGTFQIRNGMLRNDDLSLLSPLMRVAGKGTVDLPNRTVNYRIEPKLVATTKGQGGKADAKGIAVPVIVSGPWSNVSYRPDVGEAVRDVVKDPSKAMEELQKVLPGTGKSGSSDGSKSLPIPADKLKELFRR